MILKLPILNLHPAVHGGVRGETLYASRNRKWMRRVLAAGCRHVIDLRTADFNGRFASAICDTGVLYHHLPIDSCAMDDVKILAGLPELFEVIDGGEYYIACQQGRHRTDIALALYYFFHDDSEVPIMYGHRKVRLDGSVELRCDDIMRRVNRIKVFFETDEADFQILRKRFLAVNRAAVSVRDKWHEEWDGLGC